MTDSMALDAARTDGAVVVTAAVLVIGDEILSGRTKDKNIGYIAEFLTGIGIDLREVRIVPDEEPEIVAAVMLDVPPGEPKPSRRMPEPLDVPALVVLVMVLLEMVALLMVPA